MSIHTPKVGRAVVAVFCVWGSVWVVSLGVGVGGWVCVVGVRVAFWEGVWIVQCEDACGAQV